MQNNLYYLPLFEFIKKTKALNFTEYSCQKDLLFTEFIEILSKLDKQVDFNTFLFEEDDIPIEYLPYKKKKTTILYHILTLSWTEFLTIFLEKYGSKLTPLISSKNATYSLLATLYQKVEDDGASLDALVPVVFLLKDIDFIHRINPLNRKLLLINYLVNKHSEYMHDDKEFLKKLIEEQNIIYTMKEESIVSNLSTALSSAEMEAQKLWKNKSPELEDVLEGISLLNERLKKIHN